MLLEFLGVKWKVVNTKLLERHTRQTCILLKLPQRPDSVAGTKSLLIPEEHKARRMIDCNGSSNEL